MQLRWIAIAVVCVSASLLSACGNATSDRVAGRSAAEMSTSRSRYDSSGKDDDKDECDDWEKYDQSSSLGTNSSMNDECDESDTLGSWGWGSG